jgi:putative mRNA 3-end processing factor
VEYRVISNQNNEILLTNDKIKIYLDPIHIIDDNFIFISHAHTDHILQKKHLRKFNLKNKIISSTETTAIANLRGYALNDNLGSYEDFQLIDTGHILGSRGLLVNKKIFFTGDLSTRKRAFLKKPQIPRVETLIIESTFGKPEYKFPPVDNIIHHVHSLISEMYSRGIPVILMGYSLGKAQILTSIFGSWKPLIVHDDVYRFNEIYKRFGILLEDAITLSEAKEKGLLEKKPWILIYPLTSGKQNFIAYLKEKYCAVTIGFSGWAVNKNYCHFMNLDYVVPFSDHCDFDELIEVVKKCKPEKIFTIHGFQKEFAQHLKSLGFNAEPIDKIKKKKFKENEKNKKRNKTLDQFLQ